MKHTLFSPIKMSINNQSEVHKLHAKSQLKLIYMNTRHRAMNPEVREPSEAKQTHPHVNPSAQQGEAGVC